MYDFRTQFTVLLLKLFIRCLRLTIFATLTFLTIDWFSRNGFSRKFHGTWMLHTWRRCIYSGI